LKQAAMSKVPEVTLVFWIIKIAATTLGETGGDSVTVTLNWGYLAGTAFFFGLLVVLVVAQILAKKFTLSSIGPRLRLARQGHPREPSRGCQICRNSRAAPGFEDLLPGGSRILPEEVAYYKSFIDRDLLVANAGRYGKSGYGDYLSRLAEAGRPQGSAGA
jgi:hypothetical protein